MLLKGRVENGAIVLDEPRPLPEGARVRVELPEEPPAPLAEVWSPYDAHDAAAVLEALLRTPERPE